MILLNINALNKNQIIFSPHVKPHVRKLSGNMMTNYKIDISCSV